MTLETEKLSDLTCEYTLEIARNDFDLRYEKATNRVASKIHLKGFRKGKTPSSVIDQRYGESIKSEVVQELFNEEYQSLISTTEADYSWFSMPQLVENQGKTAYTIKFRSETLPPVDVGDLNEIELTKPIVEVNDDVVNARIRLAQERCTDWYDLSGKDITVSEGDRVIIAYERVSKSTESQEEAEVQERAFVVATDASNRYAARNKRFLGMSVGDKSEWTYEDLFYSPLEVDSEATPTKLTVTVTGIQIGNLLDLDESLLVRYDFLLALGLDKPSSLESLMDDVSAVLKHEIERDTDNYLRTRAVLALVGKNDTKIPRETLREATSRQFASIIPNFRGQLIDEGIFSSVLANEPIELPEASTSTNEDYDSEQDEIAEEGTDNAEGSGDDYRRFNVLIESSFAQALRAVVFEVVGSTLIKERNLEPDESWIATQIRESADALAARGEAAQVDQVYSERNYARLRQESLNIQMYDTMLTDVNLTEEKVSYEGFQRLISDEELNEELVKQVEIEAALPPLKESLPEPMHDEASDSSGETEAQPLSNLTTGSRAETRSKKPQGLLSKLFKRTTREDA